MSIIRRVIWLTALIAFLAGCSPYEAVPIQTNTQQLGGKHPGDEIGKLLTPGRSVRVRLRNEEVIEGRFLAIDAYYISIETAGNYGREENKIGMDAVIQIEVLKGGSSVPGEVIVAIGVFVGLIAFAISDLHKSMTSFR